MNMDALNQQLAAQSQAQQVVNQINVQVASVIFANNITPAMSVDEIRRCASYAVQRAPFLAEALGLIKLNVEAMDEQDRTKTS